MIHRPPNVLTLQLKRYVGGPTGYKLNRHLNFPLQLDLRPFVTEANESSVLYKLYAVLVHYGMMTTSGHYYCFVLAPSGRWYKMNDAMVCHSHFCRCCILYIETKATGMDVSVHFQYLGCLSDIELQ